MDAAMPFLMLGLDQQTQRALALAALSGGTIVLLYLFVQNLHYVSLGIFVALAGYALEWIGLTKSWAGRS